jgi:hypothetical protein
MVAISAGSLGLAVLPNFYVRDARAVGTFGGFQVRALDGSPPEDL